MQALYDPVANRWLPLSSTDAPTYGGDANIPSGNSAAVALGGGMLFVFGGADNIGLQPRAFLYKP
jgi:hypothetical protein